MRLLLNYDGNERIFDVTPEQYKELRAKINERTLALRKMGKTFDYILANLDAPAKFLATNGVVTKSTAVTAKVSEVIKAL
jgi:hypothetical protein